MSMQQLLDFATNHLMLFAALAVVLVLLAQNLLAGSSKSSLQPQAATDLINRQDGVVLDVRPMTDYANGHIINSINIPANSLKTQLNRLDKYRQRPIIVACRSGAQSSAACKQLQKAGFEKVYNLHGGILAWQNANLPISRKK
jgi:rhodanese-related sulfurtransferase